jgi:hypothetical protein
MTYTALKFVGHAIAKVVDLMASTSELPPDDRPQTDGSELVGDHNFRTGRMDCGTDPHGLYEDDL